ncbi:hypothetical protein ABTN02_19995, partial [Acinetobacter baumannii]
AMSLVAAEYCYLSNSIERNHADLLVAFFVGNLIYLHRDQLTGRPATALLTLLMAFATGVWVQIGQVAWLTPLWTLLAAAGSILTCI